MAIFLVFLFFESFPNLSKLNSTVSCCFEIVCEIELVIPSDFASSTFFSMEYFHLFNYCCFITTKKHLHFKSHLNLNGDCWDWGIVARKNDTHLFVAWHLTNENPSHNTPPSSVLSPFFQEGSVQTGKMWKNQLKSTACGGGGGKQQISKI